MNYKNMKDFKTIYQQEGAYHYHASGFKSWFLRDNYLAIAKECQKDDTVLDLACGEGCLGKYVDVFRLVGVDYSEEALCLNRKLYPNVYDELYLGDLRSLEKLEIARSSFTVVVCSLSLIYLLQDDLRKCLKDVYGFLVSGGYFICTYPTVGPYRNSSPEAAELPPEALKEELVRAGFTVGKLVPFCPLISKRVVAHSEVKDTEKVAYLEYLSAKASMTLETSYHFLCKVRKDSA